MEIVREVSNVRICCRTQVYSAADHAFHWHENCEICQVVNKPCRFLIDGTTVEAGAGDILAISEFTVHRFLITHDNTCVRIIQFPPQVPLNASVHVRPLRMHIPAAEIAGIPGLSRSLDELFGIMEREGTLSGTDENIFLETVAASLYFLLMRHFPDDSPAEAVKKDRLDFFRITQYCHEHFTEDITAGSLAERLYMSRGHLSSVFSRYSGMSLNEYLNTLRVKRTNDLLHSGYSITEAAYASGFQSIRTFNNVYRKLTGLTPSEYLHRHGSN